MLVSKNLANLATMDRASEVGHQMLNLDINGSGINKNRLRKSLVMVTFLIKNGNERLWPIFERLEDELIKLEQKDQKLRRYVGELG